MLNNGTYQSEIITDMTNKKLASEHIGENISISDAGAIYLWIPRFAINTETNAIKYILSEIQLGESWVIPNMFIYKVADDSKPDFSLSGIWIELNENVNYASTITNMNDEDGIYGFLGNTCPKQITTDDITAIEKFIDEGTFTLTKADSKKRIFLQIPNVNIVEPIKANIEYNSESNEIEIEVTYNKNPIIQIIDKETGNNIINVDNISAKKLIDKNGIYKFTVIDNKENKRELEIKVMSIIPKYYGAKISNYIANGIRDWRVFYKDDSNIYLISDDYVEYSKLPTTSIEADKAEENLQEGRTDYQGYWALNLWSSYSGNPWIIGNEQANKIAKKWVTWVEKYPNNVTKNAKVLAYMLDTKAWSIFTDEIYADYAIGGPTLEMYCKSYQVTHPTKYVQCDRISENGYHIKWNEQSTSSYRTDLTGVEDDINNIYINKDLTKASAFWLASTAGNGNNGMIYSARVW